MKALEKIVLGYLRESYEDDPGFSELSANEIAEEIGDVEENVLEALESLYAKKLVYRREHGLIGLQWQAAGAKIRW